MQGSGLAGSAEPTAASLLSPPGKLPAGKLVKSHRTGRDKVRKKIAKKHDAKLTADGHDLADRLLQIERARLAVLAEATVTDLDAVLEFVDTTVAMGHEVVTKALSADGIRRSDRMTALASAFDKGRERLHAHVMMVETMKAHVDHRNRRGNGARPDNYSIPIEDVRDRMIERGYQISSKTHVSLIRALERAQNEGPQVLRQKNQRFVWDAGLRMRRSGTQVTLTWSPHTETSSDGPRVKD